jgi:hypothetical protein
MSDRTPPWSNYGETHRRRSQSRNLPSDEANQFPPTDDVHLDNRFTSEASSMLSIEMRNMGPARGDGVQIEPPAKKASRKPQAPKPGVDPSSVAAASQGFITAKSKVGAGRSGGERKKAAAGKAARSQLDTSPDHAHPHSVMDEWLSNKFAKIYGSISKTYDKYKDKTSRPKTTKKSEFMFDLQRVLTKKIAALAGSDTARLGVGLHLPVKLPPGKMRYCKVCDLRKLPAKKRGGRSTVEWYQCGAGLCLVGCFFDWHTKKDL